MYKIDSVGSVSGHFSDGDYRTGRKGTKVPAHWLNAVQGELCNFVTANGIALNKDDNGQVLKALNKRMGKLTERRFINSTYTRVDSTPLNVFQEDVPIGGVVDFTVSVTLDSVLGTGAVAVKVFRTDDNQDYNQFAVSVDQESYNSGFYGSYRLCIQNKNTGSEMGTYKITIESSAGVTVLGNFVFSGSADARSEV